MTNALRLYLSPVDAEMVSSLCEMYIEQSVDAKGNPLDEDISQLAARCNRIRKRIQHLLCKLPMDLV